MAGDINYDEVKDFMLKHKWLIFVGAVSAAAVIVTLVMSGEIGKAIEVASPSEMPMQAWLSLQDEACGYAQRASDFGHACLMGFADKEELGDFGFIRILQQQSCANLKSAYNSLQDLQLASCKIHCGRLFPPQNMTDVINGCISGLKSSLQAARGFCIGTATQGAADNVMRSAHSGLCVATTLLTIVLAGAGIYLGHKHDVSSEYSAINS